MDRNLVLAIVLSIVIILGFQFLYQAYAPPPKKPPVTTEAPKQVVAPESRKEEPARAAAPVASPQMGSESSVKQATREQTVPGTEVLVRVDSPKYEAVLSSRGGKIISFKLKDYTATLNSNEPVNLFNTEGPDTSGPSIMFTKRDETFVDSALEYDAESPHSIVLNDSDAQQTVVFKATTSAGVTVTKKFTFKAENYEIGFSFTLHNKSNESRNYLITLPWRKFFHPDAGSRFSWDSAEILLNGELKDYAFKDIKGEEEPSGQVEWAGLGDVYFFKALVFAKNPANKVSLLKPKDDTAEIRVRYGALDLAPGETGEINLSVYLGPKERQALTAAGDNLSKALVYSYYKVLDVMAKYLMAFLRFCNSGFEIAGIRVPGTHNYGWDIILLTILIKILFIPLTHKSMKSMKRMQEIQPQIAKLKEKYKDDKSALNKATMELFRDQKVSPLGSCWPMFLQLPVFIALYQALSYAIELRHAHFLCIPSIYLCINDLSAPDPYYVTPILMGGTMVLQQWLTPSGGDPTQKKMMLLMPVVFTYLFLNFPSGLVLYWLVNNMLSIGQQVITNKMAK
ncbi:MAG TPA: membrane protein insertase YidC [Desulfomonilaceae bacterium]|nr:membrane protein insertase YidC [Desulfomonilaceae bacterium]